MKNIYIIDAVNFIFRSYFAISPMTNAKGASTHALFGFIRSVYKIIKDFGPEHIIAVFDGPDNKRSRLAIYEGYKGHRKEMPQDLYDQIDQSKIFCQLAGIPMLCIEGVEADDTIGTIAKWAEKKHAKAFMCSSDKDLCQLVSENIFVINPHKDNLLMDEGVVKEHFGVAPRQIVDYLAIVGDSSDNIPGLEGFGPKTAAQLLSDHGTLEHILAHPDVVSGKKRETLLAQKDIALLSKRLATIQTDVDIPHEETFYSYSAPDGAALKHFYEEMHFLTLLKELKTAERPAVANNIATATYHLINTELELLALMKKLKGYREICIDTETTDTDAMSASLVGVGLGVEEGEAWYVPANGSIQKEIVLRALSTLINEPGLSFYGHNVKYDMHVLQNEGVTTPEICFDTMIASYVTAPHTPRHNLDHLSLEKFGKVKIPIEDLIGKGKNQISMQDVALDKVCAYCCEDVDYTIRLKNLLEKELKENDLETVFYSIEMPLLPVLLKMEREGIFLDKAVLQDMSKELNHKIGHVEKEIFSLAGEEFNLNSPKQMSIILFEKMGLHPPKKTQTGFSTSADVLDALKDKSPIIPLILEYRTLEKLRSTYVDALPESVNACTGRIHCTFNQSIAATGRLSCQDPNLQNIPVRTEEGKKIRSAFRPEKQGHVFLAADYSQIELRLLAHLSKDPSLIEAFARGDDIHSYTAALVFGVPQTEVTSEMRYRAKTVNFGVLYGQQAFGLAEELGISMKEASAFINTYFERYGKVKEYLDSSKALARRLGYASTITGRRRPLPDIDNKNPMIRSAAERLAINTPLQGTAADLIKIAMIQIDQALNDAPFTARMLLQIHDELVFEVEEKDVKELSLLVKKIMENVFTLSVPLVVDISIGKNWGEC